MSDYEYKKILKNSPSDKVYCYCVYEGKHIPKNLGFKWDSNLKVWYMPKKDFTLKIYEESQVVRFTNYTKIGPLYYYYVHYIEGDINKFRKDEDEFNEIRKNNYKKMGNKIYSKQSQNKKIPKIDIDSIEFLDDE